MCTAGTHTRVQVGTNEYCWPLTYHQHYCRLVLSLSTAGCPASTLPELDNGEWLQAQCHGLREGSVCIGLCKPGAVGQQPRVVCAAGKWSSLTGSCYVPQPGEPVPTIHEALPIFHQPLPHARVRFQALAGYLVICIHEEQDGLGCCCLSINQSINYTLFPTR